MSLTRVFQRLQQHYGRRSDALDEPPLERLLRAALTAGSSASGVERALENLREAGVLGVAALRETADEELGELLQPAGAARLKARRVKQVLQLLDEKYGSLAAMLEDRPDRLRRRLLAVNGISAESADTILLYAADVPRFVINRHALRVLARHGWIEFADDEEAIRSALASALEPDPAPYRELHELLNRVGGEFCGKTPRCEGCPLQELLPAGGPLEPWS